MTNSVKEHLPTLQETTKRRLATYATVGAAALFGTAEVATNVTEATAADATASAFKAKVFHRHSRLKPKRVINKIHNIVPSGDWTQSESRYPIIAKSAFLSTSAGGFKTSCNNVYADTYRSYKITPTGQKFKTCGPFWPPHLKSEKNQFRGPLNNLGNKLKTSVRINSSQSTKSVKARRRIMTAKYNCPNPAINTETSGKARNSADIKKLTIKKSGRSTIVKC